MSSKKMRCPLCGRLTSTFEELGTNQRVLSWHPPKRNSNAPTFRNSGKCYASGSTIADAQLMVKS